MEDVTTKVIDILEQRDEFLECLANEPKDKRTLEDTLPCSRSTIDRGIRELETLEFLTYDDEGYVPTGCGEFAAHEYRQFKRRMEVLIEFRPFLKWISPAEFDIDLAWLDEAELLVPEPNDPYAMINRHVDALRTADRIQCLLPLTGQHAHEAAHTSVTENEAECELVVDRGVAKTLRSKDGYAEQYADMVSTGRFHVYRYRGSIPYFVGLFDDQIVQLGVDDDGEPRALLETESPSVRDWATRKFEEYKRQAELMTRVTGN